MFRDSERDGGGFAQDGDFEEAGVDRSGQVGDLFELYSVLLVSLQGVAG